MRWICLTEDDCASNHGHSTTSLSPFVLASLPSLYLHTAMVAVFYPLHLRMPVFPFLVCPLIPLALSTYLAIWGVIKVFLPLLILLI